jgi:bifunctional non-homologous end joining protein LigD
VPDSRPGEIAGAHPAPLPKFVPPQLATLVTDAPVGDEWLHEMKFDGYRILARLDRGAVRLLSRNGKDWTDHFPAVARAVERLPAKEALLDGEVAVLLPDGTTSFQALQNLLSGGASGHLVYMVFDLLHLDGRDLTGARLEDRKSALRALIAAARPAAEPARYSDHVIGAGPEFFERACRLGLEGVVAKRRDAPYKSARTPDWRKVKCVKRQEVVIGGYTDPEGSRVGIGALLVGVHEGGQLVYAGKVGTGFSDKILRSLKQRLEGLEQKASPFTDPPTGVGRPHWVKPQLVAEVAFSQWTDDGRMRHPSFQGLRDDKAASEVVREKPASLDAGEGSPPMSKPRNPGDATVAGVRLTHADRVLYPNQRITKRDLALFYESIADWIVPHLKDRPTSLVRCPEGVAGECFYQKHVGTWAPPSVRRVKIKEKTKVGDYLVVDDLPALIGLVQIGILEIHTWNSLVAELERPNRLVFDLDPDPALDWPRVVEAAHLIRSRLADAGLSSWVKTTGGKGLHVVAPLVPGPTWDAGSEFARALAEDIARREPRRYTAQMAKAARGGKIFIDYLRNVRGATSVSAYSTRATPEASVSVPVDWDELSTDLRADHFTLAVVRERLARLKKDPWKGYWTAKQSLPPGRRASARSR